jgi:hypothetical protein
LIQEPALKLSGPHQPDVIIRLKDWEGMREHLTSRWEIPEDPVKKKPIPATRWHLQVNTRGDWLLYFNVHEDRGRQQSAITHEAAESAGYTCHTFYQLFVRTD